MTESKALRPKPKSLRCFSANLLCSTQVDPSVSMIPRVLPLIPLTFSFHHHCSLPKVWQKICFTIGIQKKLLIKKEKKTLKKKRWRMDHPLHQLRNYEAGHT